TCPAVVSCADPVSRFSDPLLATTSVAPAASDFKIVGVNVVVPPPNCGNDSGRDKGAPVTSLKKLSVIGAALVPVLTRTKVVCQPSPPTARCAMLPPPVPTLANAGIVVSA